jgi:hypothetical protein
VIDFSFFVCIVMLLIFDSLFLGGMAEWLKAADLKSVDVKASVGSNPTSSAKFDSCRSSISENERRHGIIGSQPKR